MLSTIKFIVELFLSCCLLAGQDVLLSGNDKKYTALFKIRQCFFLILYHFSLYLI